MAVDIALSKRKRMERKDSDSGNTNANSAYQFDKLGGSSEQRQWLRNLAVLYVDMNRMIDRRKHGQNDD